MENNNSLPKKYYDWISIVIESCTDTFHFECVDNMIELFKQQKDEALYDSLKIARSFKWNEIHNILI